MADWPVIAARLALYSNLGLLFGLPLFALHIGRSTPGLVRIATPIAALTGTGIALSLLGFALQVAEMSGTKLAHVDPAVASALLLQTSVGWALLARLAALAFALAIALVMPARPAKLWLLAISGGVAVATLAWSGHGASSEGPAGVIHLGADILHLLAASAWIGALALLLTLVSPRGRVSQARVESAHAALAGFATLGTIIVGLIVTTGLVNGAYLVGVDRLTTLGGSPYGRLLLIKLLLFLTMLACAAANRFWLTPRLAEAIGRGATTRALALLQRSIAIETTLAIVILGLVAWLGRLEPPLSL